MPFYDYHCQACGHEFETMQGINDAPLTECPNCGDNTLKKQVSAPAFAFKGSGWYKDLYGSSKAKPSESKTSTESKPADTKKSDAKPKAAASANA
jgi:putative FmdB family regulatory protein